MKKLYATGITFLLSALFALPACAAEPLPVFISEINWAGSNLSSADEWIELYNPNDQSVDISGWILTGSATSRNALEIETGTVIDATDVILISNYPFEHEKTTLLVAADLSTSALSLPNSNLEIMFTTPEGLVVDEVVFTGTADAGSTDPRASMQRDLTSLEWNTATESINLLDDSQFGSPGVVDYVPPVAEEPEIVSDEIDPTEEVEEEPTETDLVEEETDEVETTIEETVETEESPEETTEEPSIDEVTDEDIIEDLDQTPDDIEETEVVEPETEEVVEEVEEITEEIVETEPEEVTPTASQGGGSGSSIDISDQALSYEPSSVIINEIVPDPEDGVEWLELFYPGTNAIDLTEWSVRDASGQTTALTGQITAAGFFIVENPSGNLNNSGDTIELLDPTGTVIDVLTYGIDLPAPEKGEALALNANNTWEITTQITQGSLNQFNVPAEELTETTYEEETNTTTELSTTENAPVTDQQTEQPTISNDQSERAGETDVIPENVQTHRVVAIAKETSSTKSTNTNKSQSTKNQTVSRSGTITAVPGTFGHQIAFMDGIQLYFYYADWPMLNVGDMVVVQGTASESRGEARLKLSSANDIEISGHRELLPMQISASQVIAAPEGALVQVSGQVLERFGKNLMIDDATGELTVVANDKTGMTWSGLQASDVTITGIVRHIDGNSRLYPRDMSDVVQRAPEEMTEDVAAVAAVTRPPNIMPWIGLGLLLFSLAVILYWFMRGRKTNFELAPSNT